MVAGAEPIRRLRRLGANLGARAVQPGAGAALDRAGPGPGGEGVRGDHHRPRLGGAGQPTVLARSRDRGSRPPWLPDGGASGRTAGVRRGAGATLDPRPGHGLGRACARTPRDSLLVGWAYPARIRLLGP